MDGTGKPATTETPSTDGQALEVFGIGLEAFLGPSWPLKGCRGSDKPSVTFRFFFKRMAALSTLLLMVFWNAKKCRVDMSSISHDLQVVILVRWWRDFWTIKSSWSWNGTSIFRYKDAPTMANHRYHRSLFFENKDMKQVCWDPHVTCGMIDAVSLKGWKVLSWLVEFTTQLEECEGPLVPTWHANPLWSNAYSWIK